jgi:hypothetical protein
MTALFTHRRLSLVLGIVAALAFATRAQAIVHGDFIGPDIMYLGVEEDPTKMPGPSPVELFGPPQLSGTVLDFDPMGFEAEAFDGSIAMTNSLLCMEIDVLPGMGSIASVVMGEMGGYCLMGGTANTYASVSIDVQQIKVLEVNGVAVTPFTVSPTIVYTNLGTAPSTLAFGGMRMYGDGADHDGGWTATATYDVAAAVAANGYAGSATLVEFCVDNMLKARSEEGTLAFIDKKDFWIDVNQVPEPSTIVLGAMGFVGMLIGGRKIRKSKVA